MSKLHDFGALRKPKNVIDGGFFLNSQATDRCPQCGEGRLRGWRELDEEEREVVRRLPGSADYTPAERETLHRWCPRCWFESTDDQERRV